MARTAPAETVWDAVATVGALRKTLHDERFETKDWAQSDLIGRVEWLLSMYESAKAERDDLLDQILLIKRSEK